MEKRLISALAISVLIILAFQYFTAKPVTPPQTAAIAPEMAVQSQKEASIATAKEAEPTFDEKEVVVETARYIITFSNVGGAIKDIKLKDYKQPLSGEPLELVRIKDQSAYLLDMLTSGSGPNISIANYAISRSSDSIIYTLRIDGWEITKQYVLRNTMYGIDLQISIKNESGSARDFNYRIIGGSGITETTDEAKRFIESTSMIDGKHVGFRRPNDKTIVNPGNVKW